MLCKSSFIIKNDVLESVMIRLVLLTLLLMPSLLRPVRDDGTAGANASASGGGNAESFLLLCPLQLLHTRIDDCPKRPFGTLYCSISCVGNVCI